MHPITKKERQVTTKMTKKTDQPKVHILCLAALLALSLLSVPVYAEEPAETSIFNKSITGHVGATTNQGFALIYKSNSETEYEIWFPFQEAIQFIGGYAKPSDLQYGDKVLVSYGEVSDGSKKILQSVNLITKGKPPVPAIEELEENSELVGNAGEITP